MKDVMILIGVLALLLILYYQSKPEQREHFLINDLKERLQVINKNFSKLQIHEGSSSYTEDKSVIYLCLRDERGNYYPMNTLMYVALHEIAHILNKENYGHTPEFHDIFNKLLCKASEKRVYNPDTDHGDMYCGVDISGITHPQCTMLEGLDEIEYLTI